MSVMVISEKGGLRIGSRMTLIIQLDIYTEKNVTKLINKQVIINENERIVRYSRCDD